MVKEGGEATRPDLSLHITGYGMEDELEENKTKERESIIHSYSHSTNIYQTPAGHQTSSWGYSGLWDPCPSFHRASLLAGVRGMV